MEHFQLQNYRNNFEETSDQAFKEVKVAEMKDCNLFKGETL
jgi:hypothetical protein